MRRPRRRPRTQAIAAALARSWRNDLSPATKRGQTTPPTRSKASMDFPDAMPRRRPTEARGASRRSSPWRSMRPAPAQRGRGGRGIGFLRVHEPREAARLGPHPRPDADDPRAAPERARLYLYVPLGLKPAWNGDGLVPTYPVGFPLFVLAVKPHRRMEARGRRRRSSCIRSPASLRRSPLAGCWASGGRPGPLLGAAIVALSPLYLFMSLQAMSDVPSLFWTTAAVIRR